MRLALLMLGLPTLASAQDTPTLESTMASMAGLEVQVNGHIGTGLDFSDNEALGFRSPEGTYFAVVFDAGREARRQLEGCRFGMFGGGTPCEITGKAELEWDGSQLRLIVFEVTSIESPANLP